MAEKTNAGADSRETLRPEGDTGPRRFEVVITEVGERIVHKQDWARFEFPDGIVKGGYLTTAHREEVKRVIFRGEFTERPRISALATLMETPAGAE